MVDLGRAALRIVPAPLDHTPSAEAYREQLAAQRRLADDARARFAAARAHEERQAETVRRVVVAAFGAAVMVALTVYTWAVVTP